MKYLKKFNENIEREDTKVIIDSVLDNLSKKGKLSKSQKEFMDAASNDKISDLSVPSNNSTSFLLTNPHDLYTMYCIDGVWKYLKTVEEEEGEENNKNSKNEESWEEKNRKKQLKYSENKPGLKDLLNDYLDIIIKNEKEISVVKNKLKKMIDYTDDYNFSQKLEYALKSKDSLFNQFGYILDKRIDDTGEYVENK